jgi:hypothetical protein
MFRNSYVLWRFTLCDIDILKLLILATPMFSDVTLSNLNVVWCYVLSQYRTATSTPYV